MISVAKCCLVCFTKVSNAKAVASIITNVVHTRFQTIVHMADDAVHQLICPYPTVPMERMASWWPLVLHHRQHHRLVMSVNYHRQPCQPCLPFRNRVTSTFNEQHPHLVHCPQMMWRLVSHFIFVKNCHPIIEILMLLSAWQTNKQTNIQTARYLIAFAMMINQKINITQTHTHTHCPFIHHYIDILPLSANRKWEIVPILVNLSRFSSNSLPSEMLVIQLEFIQFHLNREPCLVWLWPKVMFNFRLCESLDCVIGLIFFIWIKFYSIRFCCLSFIFTMCVIAWMSQFRTHILHKIIIELEFPLNNISRNGNVFDKRLSTMNSRRWNCVTTINLV